MPPVLLLLKGQPGSGKSTLAVALARQLGWPLIDKDDSRSAFQFLVAANPGINWNDLSYDVMFRHVERQLQCGLSVIIDCPLARRVLFDRAAALAEQHGARVALVELFPGDEGLWRQRLEQRGQQDAGTEHQHKPGSWADVVAIMERNGGSEAWSSGVDIPLRCRIDSTGGSAEQQAQQVLQMLAAASPLPKAVGGVAAAEVAARGS